MKHIKFLTILLITLAVLAVLPVAAQENAPWPTLEWATSTPEAQGVDSEKLLQALEMIQAEEYPIDSLMVIRNGYVVLDTYFWPFEKGMKHDLYSMTKIFNATLLEIAIEEGYLKGLDQPLLDIFSGWQIQNVDARKQKITIKDMLTMSPGLAIVDETGSDWGFIEQAWTTDNWTQYTLDLPMAAEPGATWTYSDLIAHVLGAAIKETTGMNQLEYGEGRFFGPLGITDIEWQLAPEEVYNGGDSLRLTPHDAAKLGYLYLNRGRWDGKQVVSPEWVDAVMCVDPTACQFYNMFGTLGYNYQSWVESTPPGYYLPTGFAGQFIFVVPSLNTVVVISSNSIAAGYELFYGPTYQILNTAIIPAATSEMSLPENADARSRLEVAVETAANPPEPKAVPPLPEMAAKISGQIYDLSPEPFDFYLFPTDTHTFGPVEGYTGDVKSMNLTFADQDASLALTFADDYELVLPIGLDSVYRVTESRIGPLAVKGYWRTDDTFRASVSFVSEGLAMNVDLNFEDTPLQITSHELATDGVAFVLAWPRPEE